MPRKPELVIAAPKAMKIEEALRFLVKLANTKIDELKKAPDDPGGLPTLLYLLRRYLDVTGEGELKSALAKASNRPDDLKKSISDVKKLLDAAVEGSPGDTEFTLNKPRKVRLALDDEGRLVSQRDGDLRESIIDVAIEDLADTKVKLLRLGHCQRQGCGNLFYKVKLNQRYCDHQCANKAAAARREGTKGSARTTISMASASRKQEGSKS
jgi:CGNR zinc finger